MKAWKQADRIGIVVHSPEVVDSGAALKLINYLRKFGCVNAVLGGTMGRVAIIDAGIEDVIAMSPKRRPSESIKDLQAGSDILILVNQAKTRESGLAFSSIVADNAKIDKPFIQIDCGGKFVAILAGTEQSIAEEISNDLGFDLLSVAGFLNGIAGKIKCEGNVTKRKLSGVLPGELITVNGIVIAKAIDSSIEIEAIDGNIVKVTGAEMKPHGIQKLPPLDLEKAIIRSGKIRRTKASPRNARNAIECKGNSVVLINHNAEDAFEASLDACIAVTVGDDTTAVASAILSRLGIPVIGITDGDLDGLYGNTSNDNENCVADIVTKNMIMDNIALQEESIIIRVEPGYDDVIGAQVKEQIFKGADRAQIKASDLIDRIIEAAGSHIMMIERF